MSQSRTDTELQGEPCIVGLIEDTADLIFANCGRWPTLLRFTETAFFRFTFSETARSRLAGFGLGWVSAEQMTLRHVSAVFGGRFRVEILPDGDCPGLMWLF